MPDGHSERPRLHEMFAVEMRPGLSESIRDLECLRSAIHATAVEGLFVMPAGANLEAAPESEQAFVRLLATLESTFELIVFDAPPANRYVTALSWLAHMDAVLMVLAEDSDTQNTKLGKRIMAGLGVKIDGVVLNKR